MATIGASVNVDAGAVPAPVVRPDPAAVAVVERANETLSPTQAFENLDAKAGDWRVEKNVLVLTQAVSHARTFIKGPRWVNCIIKAKLRLDAADGNEWNGVRLIVRGDENTDTFYTVGFSPGRTVRIEKSRGLAFEKMAAAPFPVESGKTYEVTVVVDGATIYCFIDGKFVVLGQEQDFTTQPFGRVGFYMNRATGAFSDVSVKGLKGSPASLFTPYAGNPLNVTMYSPAVIKDDKYRMWGVQGPSNEYAESEDGIVWTRKESLFGQGNTGDWPTGNQSGDQDVLKFDGQYWITFWSTCNRRGGAFDGMGIKRSTDGIHWTPEPANPVFYMGPNGDWDEMVVGDHAMIRDGDRFKLWHVGITFKQRGYRNEFGYAESQDGLHWRKCRLNPVLTQGHPGTWDGGWIYAAGIVKIDDEQSETHVYAGKPGASYHLFYTGQPTNDEVIPGVKRIGYAFSLDGIHWVKWNDPNTSEPFQDSDPVMNWVEYGQPGYLGVGAATALRVGDEVRLYYSMYDERPDTRQGAVVLGTGFASVKVATLRKIVADAKAKGLLKTASREEIEATLDDALPQSMWDDLQGRVLAAIQAQQSGNADGEKSALAEIAATRAKFTKALQRHYADAFAPLKEVVAQLEAKHPLTERVLWSLPAERKGKYGPQFELTGLNVAAGTRIVMIEIEAKCDRFGLARVAFAENGFRGETEFIAGYSGVEYPTHRVTIATGGRPISALGFQFPGGVDLKQVRIHELKGE